MSRGGASQESMKILRKIQSPYPRPSELIPSVGRIVHYVAYGTPGGEFPAGVHRAAIITEVHDTIRDQSQPDPEMVGLQVINPTGVFFNTAVKHDEDTKAPGSWHWPEMMQKGRENA